LLALIAFYVFSQIKSATSCFIANQKRFDYSVKSNFVFVKLYY